MKKWTTSMKNTTKLIEKKADLFWVFVFRIFLLCVTICDLPSISVVGVQWRATKVRGVSLDLTSPTGVCLSQSNVGRGAKTIFIVSIQPPYSYPSTQVYIHSTFRSNNHRLFWGLFWCIGAHSGLVRGRYSSLPRNRKNCKFCSWSQFIVR